MSEANYNFSTQRLSRKVLGVEFLSSLSFAKNL